MTIVRFNTGSCPTKDEFERVLSGNATFEVELEFYEHLRTCSLCSDAFEGYKIAGVTTTVIKNNQNKEPKIINIKQYLVYAASVILLFGGYVLFRNIETEKAIFAFSEIPYSTYISGQSFAKSIDTYWTINANGNILLNDQIISESDIDNIDFHSGSKAYVSVHSVEKDIPVRIINKLKQRELSVLAY